MNQQPDEEIQRARYVGRSEELPCPLQILLESPCVHQPRSSLNFLLLVFMEPSLHRHDRLNHWPMVIEFNLWTSSLHWRSGG